MIFSLPDMTKYMGFIGMAYVLLICLESDQYIDENICTERNSMIGKRSQY
jgi:hypothetical protein